MSLLSSTYCIYYNATKDYTLCCYYYPLLPVRYWRAYKEGLHDYYTGLKVTSYLWYNHNKEIMLLSMRCPMNYPPLRRAHGAIVGI